MRPETPVWGWGASCAFCVSGGTFVLGMFGAFFCVRAVFFRLALC